MRNPVVFSYGPETMVTVMVQVYVPTYALAGTSTWKVGSRLSVPTPWLGAAEANVFEVPTFV